MRERSLQCWLASGILVLLACGAASAAEPPPADAFTYQGRLAANGQPAQGEFDLRFGLYPAAADLQPYAPVVTNANVVVTDGLFTVMLHFDPMPPAGSPCWLDIGVRESGSEGVFTTLFPRQRLSPAPYAIHTLRAERLTGPITESQLPANVARLDADQTFSGGVRFDGAVSVQGEMTAGSYAGDGSGLSNVVAGAMSARMAQQMWRVAIPFVTVTNAGNLTDETTGLGGVDYVFRMGKYEINNHQYAVFLNAVAAEDPARLYTDRMETTIHGGIVRTGNPGEYGYEVKPGMGHRPVAWVDYMDAMRFCNWLHNGQPAGSQNPATTEDGAYTITEAGLASNTVERNAHARFWVPSDDEWYKAAYHHPLNQGGEFGDYWLFPTRNSAMPVSEPPPGGVNSMNACCETARLATDVGAYTNAFSFYGTFDQGGNVQEWTEAVVYATNRRLRGGSWLYNVFYASTTDLEFDTIEYEGEDGGFRVAGAVE